MNMIKAKQSRFSKQRIPTNFLWMFVCVCELFNHVRLFATAWTIACQAPPSMGFSS